MHYTAGRHLYAHTGATAYTLTILGYIHVTAKEELSISSVNPLTPNDPYRGRTAPLTSKRCILCIYSTNIVIEYFKYDIYSPFFSLQNAVCFIILIYFVPVLFTFYIQGLLKLKKKIRRKRLTWGIQYYRNEKLN